MSAHDRVNELSACIFLAYRARYSLSARLRLQARIRPHYQELAGQIPGQSHFLAALIGRRFSIGRPPPHEATVSLQRGCCAQISRILHALPLTEEKRIRVGELICELRGLSISDGPYIYWPSYFRGPDDGPVFPGLSLSMHNGLGGAISILSLCWSFDIERKLCMRLLRGVVRQVVRIERAYGGKGLPAFCGHPELKERHARRSTALYGDAAMGYAIALAGHRCVQDDWVKIGAVIFKRGIARSSRAAQAFGHGLATGEIGLSHLAHRFYQMSGDREVLEHSQRWRASADNRYAADESRRDADASLKSAEVKHLFNSELSYWMVRWFQQGKIDGCWDSLFGLSNPVSGEIL